MRKFAVIWIIALVAVVNFSGYAAAQQQNCTGKSDSGWDTQIAACTAVIKASKGQGKDLASAFGNRGNAYFAKAQYDRALQGPDQAIKLDPDYAAAFCNRGSAYFGKAEYDRAIQDFDQAIKLDPNLALAFSNRGNAYSRQGQYDRAIQDLDQAIRLDPNYAIAFAGRGNAYYGKARYNRAIQDLDQAIKLDPTYAEAFNDRCWSRTIVGRELDQALKDCNESLRLRPNY